MTERKVQAVEDAERKILEDRVARLRAVRPVEPLDGRIVVVVDDGMATGSTARVACRTVRRLGAERVVLAVPVAPLDTLRGFSDADEFVVLACPDPFTAVGRYYRSFPPTGDDAVSRLLDAAARRPTPGSPAPVDEEVVIPVEGLRLEGTLHLEPSGGVVVFAHGSGSSRHSPRNRSVAQVLQRAGLGTLLFDLLSPDEENDRHAVFDIERLATRLRAATDWLRTGPAVDRPIGYFGASTGAAAALWAAAEPDAGIGAIVSRGGRPDLAAARLAAVSAPTLLIVGGADDHVLELNLEAAGVLTCAHRLDVIAGATHLFEEPGALDQVAALASEWFTRYLEAPA